MKCPHLCDTFVSSATHTHALDTFLQIHKPRANGIPKKKTGTYKCIYLCVIHNRRFQRWNWLWIEIAEDICNSNRIKVLKFEFQLSAAIVHSTGSCSSHLCSHRIETRKICKIVLVVHFDLVAFYIRYVLVRAYVCARKCSLAWFSLTIYQTKRDDCYWYCCCCHLSGFTKVFFN